MSLIAATDLRAVAADFVHKAARDPKRNMIQWLTERKTSAWVDRFGNSWSIQVGHRIFIDRNSKRMKTIGLQVDEIGVVCRPAAGGRDIYGIYRVAELWNAVKAVQ
jgi:hypothetical protein